MWAPPAPRYWALSACYSSGCGNALARSAPGIPWRQRRSGVRPSAKADRGRATGLWAMRSRGVLRVGATSSRPCGAPRRCRRGACPAGLLFLGVAFCSWPNYQTQSGTLSTPIGNRISVSHFPVGPDCRLMIKNLFTSMHYAKCERVKRFALSFRTSALKVRND